MERGAHEILAFNPLENPTNRFLLLILPPWDISYSNALDMYQSMGALDLPIYNRHFDLMSVSI
jgi:hypothetical protein